MQRLKIVLALAGIVFFVSSCAAAPTSQTAAPAAESAGSSEQVESGGPGQECIDSVNALRSVLEASGVTGGDPIGAGRGAIELLADGVSCYQDFDKGTIVWRSTTGAMWLFDVIRDKWYALGREDGQLGYPIPIQDSIAGGVFQDFDSGSIAWHPDIGAFEISGDIKEKWVQVVEDKLGFPTTDGIVAPDGIGRFNHFQDGSIYWHPDTGAYEVHGAVRAKWADLGWEKSFLGYPISDEIEIGENAHLSRFQGGAIFHTDEGGATEIALDRGIANYLIRLDKFHINTTRSVDEDTDFVSFLVTATGEPFMEPQVKSMGDVDDGDHLVGLDFLPVLVRDSNSAVLFNYEIVNSGYDPSIVEEVLKAGAKSGADYLLAGSGVLVDWTWKLIAADCDGVVAKDAIRATGAMLEQWTNTTDGAYTETKEYPGTDSAWGCGDNSNYTVTWWIVRL